MNNTNNNLLNNKDFLKKKFQKRNLYSHVSSFSIEDGYYFRFIN